MCIKAFVYYYRIVYSLFNLFNKYYVPVNMWYSKASMCLLGIFDSAAGILIFDNILSYAKKIKLYPTIKKKQIFD